MTIEEYDVALQQLTEAKKAHEILAKNANEIVKALDQSIEAMKTRRNAMIDMEAILNSFRKLLEQENADEVTE